MNKKSVALAALIAVGFACDGGGSQTPPAFDCATCAEGSEYCTFSECRPLLAVGASCAGIEADRDPCSRPEVCRIGVCTPPVLAGEDCFPGDVPCAEGLICDRPPGTGPFRCVRPGAQGLACSDESTCRPGLSCLPFHGNPDANICTSRDMGGMWVMAKLPVGANQLDQRPFALPKGGPYTYTFVDERLCMAYPSDCNPGAQNGACGTTDLTITVTGTEGTGTLTASWPARAVGQSRINEGGFEGDVSAFALHTSVTLVATGRNDCSPAWTERIGGLELWFAKCACGEEVGCWIKRLRDNQFEVRCDR